MGINKRTNSSIKRLNTFGLSYWELNLYHIGEQNLEEKYITEIHQFHVNVDVANNDLQAQNWGSSSSDDNLERDQDTEPWKLTKMI